jgi:hypothetical protein
VNNPLGHGALREKASGRGSDQEWKYGPKLYMLDRYIKLDEQFISSKKIVKLKMLYA